MKARSHKRRHLARRRRERRVFSAVLKSLFGIGVLLALYMFLTSDFFLVDRVSVSGLKRVTAKEIQEAAGLSRQLLIWGVWPWRVKAGVESLPRVAKAEVHLRLPRHVSIDVREREPLALLLNDGKYLEVDGEGFLLAVHDTPLDGEFPLVTGPRVSEAVPGVIIRDPRLQRALGVLSRMNAEVYRRVSEVHVDPSNEVVLYTTDGIAVYLGVRDELEEMAQALGGILRALGHPRDVEYIDLRSARRPVVRMKFSLEMEAKEKGNR